MTYNVFIGTLNPTQSINQSHLVLTTLYSRKSNIRANEKLNSRITSTWTQLSNLGTHSSLCKCNSLKSRQNYHLRTFVRQLPCARWKTRREIRQRFQWCAAKLDRSTTEEQRTWRTPARAPPTISARSTWYAYIHTQLFHGPFSGLPGWADARRNLQDFTVQGNITEADTATIFLGATPSRLISAHLHHPPIFFSRMPFLLQPGLRQAPNMLACIPSGMVNYSM